MASKWFEQMKRDKEEEERQARAAQAAQASSPVTVEQPDTQPKVSVTPDIVQRAQSMTSANQRTASAFKTYQADIVKPDVEYVPAFGMDENGKNLYDFSHLSQGGLNDAVRMSAMISNSKERENFLGQVETERQNRFQRTTSMKTLNGMSLYGLDGNVINANTADASTVMKGINLIADDDERSKAKDAFLTLTKTPGSRFYGMELNTDNLGTFLNSAALSKSDYNSEVNRYSSLFYGDGKHDTEDAEAYLYERESILSMYEDSPYAQSQLLAALDKVYTSITGGKTPDGGQVESSEKTDGSASQTAQNAERDQTEEEDGEKKATGFIAGITGEAARQWEEQKGESQAQDAVPVSVVQPSSIASASSAEESRLVNVQGREVQGPVQMSELEQRGAMGFEEWQAAGMPVPMEQQDTGYIEVHDDGDVAAAYMSGQYDRVAPEDRKTFDPYLKSPTAQTVLGLFSASDAEIDNIGAENVVNNRMGELGHTAYTVMQMIESEDFPQELYGLGVATMARLGLRADELEQQGLLGGDESLPLMERLLTTDDFAMQEIQNLYDARDSLIADEAERREETQRQSDLALKEARSAVLRGTASDEQKQLVLQNANVTPYEINNDNSYWNSMLEVGAYFATSAGGQSAYQSSAVARGVSASGVVDDKAYQSSLEMAMNSLLEEDATLAHSLGMSLEEYYSATGGMSMDTLCQRAATRMSRQGASITQEDMQALEMPYGDGVGAGTVLGMALRYGTQEFFASYGESLYMGLTQMNVVRTAGEMQLEYSQKYGTFGREVYRRDLLDLANSGTVPQEFSDALKRALNETGDIYDIGIDPEALGWTREFTSGIRRNQETCYSFVREEGTEGENRAFMLISSMTTNAWNAGAAAAVTALTKNPKLGFAIGYSIPEWGNRYRTRLAEGYRMGTASSLASIDTLGSYIANVGTFEGIYGRITGMNALKRAGIFSMIQKNPSGAIKGLAAIRRYSAGNAIVEGGKAFVQNTLDEAVGDKFKEGLSQEIIDKTIVPLFQKADAREEIGMSDMLKSLLNLKNVDIVGIAKDVKNSFVDEAIASSLFSLAGAVGAGVRGYKSTKAASDIVSGKSQDVQSFVDAAVEDLQNAEFCEKIDNAARSARADEETASALLLNRDENGMMDKAAKAREQQQSHEQQASASEAAMKSAQAVMDSAQQKREQGDISPETAQEIVDASMAYAKNRTGLNEHTREAAQKKEEADEAVAALYKQAKAKSKEIMMREDATAYESILSNKEARNAEIDRKVAQLDEEIADFERRIQEANDMGLDEEALEELFGQLGTIQIQREDLIQEKNVGMVDDQAVELARQKAKKQLYDQDREEFSRIEEARKGEEAKLEAEDMKTVWRDLSRLEFYVDDVQAANILHKTGLSSMTKVNARYGTKIRTSKSKKRPARSLDGGFWQELVQNSKGRLSDDVNPEEAIIDLLERKFKIQSNMQASIGDADMKPYLPDGRVSRGTDAPQTQKLGSILYERTGIELVVAPLANNVRALYDRENGRLILSSRMGAGERARQVVMHEVTHYIENTAGYDTYAESALEAAYDGDEAAMERDAQEIREQYEAAGISLGKDGVYRELVAQATEKLVDAAGKMTGTRSENLVYDLLGKKMSFPIRVYTRLNQFLARHRAQKQGTMKRYESIVKARDNLKAAIQQAGKWKKGMGGQDTTIELDERNRANGKVRTQGEQTEMQFSLVDRTEDGKGVYVSNFAEGTTKTLKTERLIDQWQNVWSKKPIQLVFDENGKQRTVTARFDPDYDPNNKRMTDLGKVVHSKNGSSGDRNITLNLADDLYDIATGARHVDREIESGKPSATHAGVKEWHYFSNDFVYRDSTGDKPMTLWLDIKEKEDGGWVYQLYARKTKKETQSSYARTVARLSSEDVSLSDTTIAQGNDDVNTQSIQDGVQYALAPRQFAAGARKTVIEKADWTFDQVKKILDDYDQNPDSNRAQFDRAKKTLDEVGYEAAYKALLSMKRDFTADDNMLGALLMIEARNRGDLLTQTMLATKMRDEASRQGRDLQSWRGIAKLTPEGAMASAVQRAREDNVRKGLGPDAFPVGHEPPKRGRTRGETETGAGTDTGAGTGTGMDAGTQTERSGMQPGTGTVTGTRSRTGRDGSSVFPADRMQDVRAPEGTAVQGTFLDDTPKELKKLRNMAERVAVDLSSLSGNVSRENKWHLPLSEKHMGLIRQYGLEGTELAGMNYNRATRKQRMLAAIVSSDPDINGDALLTLTQQLEGIRAGYSVVTDADLAYINAQVSEMIDAEGGETNMPRTQEGRTALGRASDAQSNIVDAGNLGRLMALRFANMLSSSATMVRNIASNVLVDPMESASTAVGEVVDRIVAQKTGNRTTAIPSKDAVSAGRKAFAHEVAQTYADYFVTHTDTSHGRRYQVGDGGRTFENNLLETYRSIVDFAMQIGDRPFYERCFAQEMDTLKRLNTKTRDQDTGELREMTEDEMRQEATQRALERVFQEDGVLIKHLNQIKRESPFANLAMSLIIPFTKTPTNISKRIFQYSPIGLTKAILYDGLYNMTSNNGINFDQRKFVMNIGRGMTGTAMIGVGALLGAMGIINLGREEEKDQKRAGVFKALGIPYSAYLDLFGTKHEIDWALPMAGPMIVGANIAKLLSESDEDSFFNTSVNMLISMASDSYDLLFENSMLSAVQELFRYGDSSGVATRFFQTAASSFASSTLSPSFMRAIAKATDPYVRDTASQNFAWGAIKQSVIQNWPGLRQMLPIAKDITGDDVLNSGYWSGGQEHANAVLNMWDSFFTPTQTISEKNDKALMELTDLSYRTGETSFLPSSLLGIGEYEVTINKTMAKALHIGFRDGTYNSVSIALTDDEKRQLNSDYANLAFNGAAGGMKLKTGIRKLVDSPAWQRMDDEDRVDQIASILKEAKEKVLADIAKQKKEEGALR